MSKKRKVVAVIQQLTDSGVEDFLLENSPRFRRMLNRVKREKGGTALSAYRKSRGI